ncbi:MAG: 6-carboxytetrahydropterin synthase QueD [Bacillota bacterium]
MYEVSVSDHFDAAHFLRGYKGKCEALHGHRWKVEVSVRTGCIDETGLAYDFRLLRESLRDCLSMLDHCLLNEREPFLAQNPSSENIALYIHTRLKEKIAGARLGRVTVYESPDAWVSYAEG